MTEELLANLKRHANDRGLVLVREQLLTAALRTTRSSLWNEIRKLERAGLVELLSPAPYLVLRLQMWPASGKNSAKTSHPAHSYRLFKQESVESNSNSGEPEDDLLREILETLGESDPEEFRPALGRYPPDLIRNALDRVRRAKDIRKNPTALFRYLLVKLSNLTS